MTETQGQGACLYLIATPIGNLEDMSARSRRLLTEVDVIAAEDTRTAGKLLQLLNISGKKVMSYFEGNEAARSEQIVEMLQQGQSVGLISEAGTPAVSDPGQRVVASVAAAGLSVVPIPGPSAVICALIASGLPTDAFAFYGFLPREQGERRRRLGMLAQREETLVFYESPERAAACLADMAEAFGDERPVVLAREVTKVYEEFVRGSASSLAEIYRHKAPRGECTFVVGGATPNLRKTETSDEELVRELLLSGLGPKDVASRLMVKTGGSRRSLYQLALSLQRELESDSEE